MIKNTVVNKNFTKSSSVYDEVAVCQKQVARNLACKVSELIDAANIIDVLELGCGTGFLSTELVDRFPTASFLLNDLSQDMADVCHQKLIDVEVDHSFIVGDVRALKLDSSFDLIVSSLAFQWLEEGLEDVLEYLMTRLKPGGLLAFSTLVDGTFGDLKKAFDQADVPFTGPCLLTSDWLLSRFPAMSLDHEIYKDQFESVVSFLKQLKLTGAVNATGKPITVAELRNIMNAYTMISPSSTIIADYHICYCFLRKPF